MNKKNDFSIIVLPILTGLTGDLLFWIAIKNLFFVEVRHFNASQISLLTSVGAFAVIVGIVFAEKIVNKIGNLNSFRLGILILLVTAIIITFCESYNAYIVAYGLYSLAFLFKNMDCLVLEANLLYAQRGQDYIKFRNFSSLIYSITTMIIAFAAGSIYAYNPFLPMYMCISVLVIVFALSLFVSEPTVKRDIVTSNANEKVKLSKVFIYLIVCGIVGHCVIDSGMSQIMYFVQYRMDDIYGNAVMTKWIFIIVALSRIVRTLGNVYASKKRFENNKYMEIIGYLLLLCFVLTVIGELCFDGIFKIILAVIGYFIILATRDIWGNGLNALVLKNTVSSMHRKAMTYLTLANKLGNFVFNLLISIILINNDIFYSVLLIGVLAIVGAILFERIDTVIKTNN